MCFYAYLEVYFYAEILDSRFRGNDRFVRGNDRFVRGDEGFLFGQQVLTIAVVLDKRFFEKVVGFLG